jgi:hypothetical protein
MNWSPIYEELDALINYDEPDYEELDMSINYTLDFSRYNYAELECFLAEGIITVGEFHNEVKARELSCDTVTPPDSELKD